MDRAKRGTPVYWAIFGVSWFCNLLSLTWLINEITALRRRKYICMDFFVFAWLAVSFWVFAYSSAKGMSCDSPSRYSLPLVVLLAYRCLTLGFGHVNILFFDSGKSTSGANKIHSKIRYLALTALNYVELLFWNSALTVWLQPLGSKAAAYKHGFDSRVEVVYYNFVTITTLGYGDNFPKSAPAQLQTILGTAYSVFIIAVLVTIVIGIRREDEIFRPEKRQRRYWRWRAGHLGDVKWTSELRELVLSKIQKLVEGGKDVVDLCCGVGHQATLLAENGYKVTGIDYSGKMIRLARARKAGKLHKLRYKVADAQRTGLPDSKTDAVILCMALHNILPDWKGAIREASRILKPGGIVVIVEGVPPSDECEQFFKNVLSQTHKRHFFAIWEVIECLDLNGFTVLEDKKMYLGRVRVRKWLTKVVREKEVVDDIYEMHKKMPLRCREAYNYRELQSEDDISIDCLFRVIVAARGDPLGVNS